MVSVAIIGTSGRDKNPGLSTDLLRKMAHRSLQFIRNDLALTGKVHLISGGAAWADHVAVILYLAWPNDFSLTLCLPCEFSNGTYLDNGAYDWRVNPGKTSNYYHKQFTSIYGRDSLSEIQQAIGLGATVKVFSGFHDRNNEICLADHMIAFTWSTTDIPTDGGTKYTWDHYRGKGKRVHLSLGSI